ncbi:MAG: response regulator transcription factor [Bryobacteraceae bacterium]|nr:response regulator transcription factor [Bryobacteraceae bacterium]
MNPVKILIADDHGIVRRGLRSLLERQNEFEVVGEANDGKEAVDETARLQPDIVVMDIAMPHLNGIDAAQQIMKKRPETSVVLFSMYADESYLIRALNAGVKGYLLKDSADTDLVPAVQAAVQGKSYFSPQISEVLSEDYTRNLRQRGLEDSHELLTDREKEVLQLLAEGRSNKEVAALLNLSPYTVETHRTRIMQKLNLHSTADIVLYAVRKKIIT